MLRQYCIFTLQALRRLACTQYHLGKLFTVHIPVHLLLKNLHRAGQFVGAVTIPALVHKIKFVHYQLSFAVAMQTVFFGLAALITPTNLSWLMACQFFAMLPFAWITLNCYTAVSFNVPQRDLGVAIGLIGTFRCLGGAIGSVLFSSIFKQTAVKHVGRRVTENAAAAGMSNSKIVQILAAVPLALVGVPETITGVPAKVFEACVTAARYGYADGLRITWLSSIPFGVIALACALAVRDPSKYFTNHVEVHLNRKVRTKFLYSYTQAHAICRWAASMMETSQIRRISKTEDSKAFLFIEGMRI